jgi:hypothetical protein
MEVATVDNIIIEYIAAVAAIEYRDIIIISKGREQEYKVPRTGIIRYNDTEILLDILFGELDRYMINLQIVVCMKVYL